MIWSSGGVKETGTRVKCSSNRSARRGFDLILYHDCMFFVCFFAFVRLFDCLFLRLVVFCLFFCVSLFVRLFGHMCFGYIV